MIVGIEQISLALTPVQRWSAARQMNRGPTSITWFVVTAAVLLIILAVLFVWVSYSHRLDSRKQMQEMFAEQLRRRGLGRRECQILLAIAMRSGVRGVQGILSDAKAFDLGARRLLAEFSRVRTPQESSRLELQVNRLRENLGFGVARVASDVVGSEHQSSRDIPLGKAIELTRQGNREDASVHAKVVGNDETELAVELQMPVASKAGELWRLRYCCGTSAYELETSTARSEGHRLILNHTKEARLVGRRQVPRLILHAPALVACLPFLREASVVTAAEATRGNGLSDDVPNFMEGVVTEVSGPYLRIKAPLPVRPGDRILTLFRLAGGASRGAGGLVYAIAGAGRVRQCLSGDRGISMVVELTDLNDVEIDKFADIVDTMPSRFDGNQGSGVAAEQISTHVIEAAQS